MQIYGLFFVFLIRNNKCMISFKLRDKILIRQNGKCCLCKTKFNKHIPHEIHHLNHNSSDNNIHNLIFRSLVLLSSSAFPSTQKFSGTYHFMLKNGHNLSQ